jgi:HK97 gp10 family phage protein
MTSIKLSVVGLDELTATLAQYGQRAEKEISNVVRITAFDVEADAIKSIQRGTKSGRTYEKFKPRRTHRASAPGEAPAGDTGDLARRITAEKERELQWSVGTDLPYGRFLEFGTMKIAERPWLRPAIEKNRALFRKRIVVAIEKASQ